MSRLLPGKVDIGHYRPEPNHDDGGCNDTDRLGDRLPARTEAIGDEANALRKKAKEKHELDKARYDLQVFCRVSHATDPPGQSAP